MLSVRPGVLFWLVMFEHAMPRRALVSKPSRINLLL
jgi:hypothetical protein